MYLSVTLPHVSAQGSLSKQLFLLTQIHFMQEVAVAPSFAITLLKEHARCLFGSLSKQVYQQFLIKGPLGLL